jgi:hypothetical protein
VVNKNRDTPAYRQQQLRLSYFRQQRSEISTMNLNPTQTPILIGEKSNPIFAPEDKYLRMYDFSQLRNFSAFSLENLAEQYSSTLTNASVQVIHAFNNTATQFATHTSTLAASGLPIAATFGFVPGLMIGFKKR